MPDVSGAAVITREATMNMGLAKWGAGIAVIAGVLGIARPAAAQNVQYANYKNPNLCMDTYSHGVVNGTNVVLHACNQNYQSQFWAPDTDNPLRTEYGPYYMERNFLDSAKCLGIDGNSGSTGAQAKVWDCFPFSQWGLSSRSVLAAPARSEFVAIFSGMRRQGCSWRGQRRQRVRRSKRSPWRVPAIGPFKPDRAVVSSPGDVVEWAAVGNRGCRCRWLPAAACS